VAEKTILLVRHGQFDTNDTTSDLGPGLTKLGRRQAVVTGKWLSTLPIAQFYSSPLNRAQQTAELIVSCVPGARVTNAPELREVIPTPVPGMRVQNLANHRASAKMAFAQFFTSPTRDGRLDVLICHGNLIRYLLCRAMGAKASAWLKLGVCHHCALSECRINASGEVRVCSYNDASHLPLPLRTI